MEEESVENSVDFRGIKVALSDVKTISSGANKIEFVGCEAGVDVWA
jgi:hypothetical protein